jgi:hypothetical protein
MTNLKFFIHCEDEFFLVEVFIYIDMIEFEWKFSAVIWMCHENIKEKDISRKCDHGKRHTG